MPAGIETAGDLATFASYLKPGWHGLGTVFTEHVTTKRMLELAKLANWRFRQITMADATGMSGVGVENKFLNVRKNPFTGKDDVIGVVGGRYTLHSNEELLDFGDAVFFNGARWETAGSIDGGRLVFATLVLPDSIIVDPNGIADEIQKYILLRTAHDGTASTTMRCTPVRVVCKNTDTAAITGNKAQVTLRHTSDLNGRVQKARDAMQVSLQTLDDFGREAQELFEAEITTNQFYSIVEANFPNTGTARGDTRRTNVRDTFMDIYLGSGDMPNTTEGVRGTKWGAINAVTAYANHHAVTHDKGDGIDGRDLIRLGEVSPKWQDNMIAQIKALV